MKPFALGAGVILLSALVPDGVRAQEAASPAARISSAPVAGVATDDRARALLLTDLLLGERRVQEADAFVKAWREKDPEQSVWILRQARIRELQGRHAESAGLYKLMLDTNAEDPGIMLQVGRANYASGNLKEAEEVLLQAREKSKDPLILFYLSETARARGDEAGSRRWAQTGLSELKDTKDPAIARLSLLMRARLGWNDDIDRDYQKLYTLRPDQKDTLLDWTNSLLNAGLHDWADEPLALLDERFPDQELKVRQLRMERLLRAGPERRPALQALLDESLARFPQEPSFHYQAADLDYNSRRWESAREHLEVSRLSGKHQRSSDAYLEEVRRQYDHHLGPEVLLKRSEGTTVFGQSLRYHGYARKNVRVEASAGRADYRRRRSGAGTVQTGLWASVARESARWVAGMDADIRTSPGFSAVSPGVFGEWDPCESCVVRGKAAIGRAWTGAAEGVPAGAKTNSAELKGRFRPWRRLSLGAYGEFDMLSVRSGGKATHLVWGPEAVWTLTSRPFFSALGYRFAAGDAAGDAAFFSTLPLLRRFRTHYLTLAASRHWVERKLRAGAYVFNGQDDGRGSSFGTASLVGGGFDVDWQLGPIQWLASYNFSLDDVNGVGGKSHTLRMGAMWRWARKSAPKEMP